jgi:hypothetical protein
MDHEVGPMQPGLGRNEPDLQQAAWGAGDVPRLIFPTHFDFWRLLGL